MTKLPILALTVLLAGCGGSSGGKSYASVADIADALGCSSSLDQDAPADKTMFTSESGSCSFGGGTVYLSTFTGPTPRDNYLKVAKQSGGRYDVGPRWIVYGDDDKAADAVKAKLGGTIKS